MGYEDFEDYEDEKLEELENGEGLARTETIEVDGDLAALGDAQAEESELGGTREISFGARSKESIERNLRDVRSEYSNALSSYEQLKEDASKGWIGVEPNISKRKAEMDYCKSKIAELERELSRAED